MLKSFKVILINFLIFFLIIVLLEIIFGDWFKKNNWGNSLRSERLKKITYNVKFNNQKYKHVYKKNSFGFRGKEVEPIKLKFLMMGGSTVNERFTPEKLTIVGNLNRLLLDDKNKIEIFNGGVDGQSTIGLINNFEKWFSNIENFKPELIIYYIGVNERFYFNFDPNPINLFTGEFKTNHAFDKMMKISKVDQLNDFIKNNSFFLKNGKMILLKYFPGKKRKEDYSKFKAIYDLEHGVSDNFYTQTNMDELFKIDSLNHKNKIFVVSLKKRIEHLTLLTTQIGAQPIFINQVLNDGQLSEKMYLTNYIIREYCLENDLKFIDLAKDIILDKHDFYDEFHTTPSGSKKIAEYIFPHFKNYLE
tara:strand:+ start:632 stop:1714 length:1083 start_codon:yes stop_codon:yes gene_type:complete